MLDFLSQKGLFKAHILLPYCRAKIFDKCINKLLLSTVMKKQNTILLLFLFFSFDSQSQNISKLRLQNHLEYLASDELEGRETTYRGQKIAAKYIANHFRSLGLKILLRIILFRNLIL